MRKSVRIGCGGGFWGDSPEGAAQIVHKGDVQYLVMDYLAEVTMSILARVKTKFPDAGFATDFVTQVMEPLAGDIAAKGIRVVVNAGGVNLNACRSALEKVFVQQGLSMKVAVLEGDDLSSIAGDLHNRDTREMFSGAPFPEKPISINAYLGAFGIARAFDAGADIVLTGRVVDSALVLGPLIHEFGWSATDFDLLSAGSLAGHLLECGTQATGGIFTDWRKIAGWDDMGFPVAICHDDGAFEITKPEGTGGLVTPQTVAEQLTYEVGDPAAYILPDVICDWSNVRLSQAASDVVRVEGARGSPPPDSFKASATWLDGYRSAVNMMIIGREAAAKAQATGEAILARVSRLVSAAGLGPFRQTLIEVLGAESYYGPQARVHPFTREVVLKLAVHHNDRRALDIFAREIYPAACSMAQGLTGFAGGRPTAQPVMRLFSCLVPKTLVTTQLSYAGQTTPLPHPARVETTPAPTAAHAATDPSVDTDVPLVRVPLIAIAHGRSGDKGDTANISVLAREPEDLPWIRRGVTTEAVAQWLGHLVEGRIERFEWPGLSGLNFLLNQALGGGGVASLRHDPQGKALAQILLDMPVAVPAAWVAPTGRLAEFSTEILPYELP